MFIVITILECYNLFSGVELSMRPFFVISIPYYPIRTGGWYFTPFCGCGE